MGDKEQYTRARVEDGGFVRHNFDCFCSLVHDELCNHTCKNIWSSADWLLENHKQCNIENIALRHRLFVRTLWLSMKYWNKYQLLHFVNHHLCKLHKLYNKQM